jgi:hypothetical protein
MSLQHEAFDTETLVPGYHEPELPTHEPDAATVAASEERTRHWSDDAQRRIKYGSAEHKQMMCRMFKETFNPYRPSVLKWPTLNAESLQRIVSLPIWDIAVQTEGKARLRMAAYARTLTDPDMRNVLAQNAWEENRHKEVLSKMVQHYGIPLAEEPPYIYPTDPEWAYLVTGYSECIDSFFAFGLFKVAHDSGLFPGELIDTFEPVMQEECRHILLFANWVAWHRANLSLFARIAFEFKVFRVWCFLGWERMELAKSLDGDDSAPAQDNNFTVTGAQSVTNQDLSIVELMQWCLDENDRRFAGYDRRLLRPTTMPFLVRCALPVLKFFARLKRKPAHA